MSDTTELTVRIQSDKNIPEEKLEQLTYALRDELRELDVGNVALNEQNYQIPEGAKSGEFVEIGTILLSLVGGSTFIPSVINGLQSWLQRNDRKKLTIEIKGDKLELTGASKEQQNALISDWLAKHT